MISRSDKSLCCKINLRCSPSRRPHHPYSPWWSSRPLEPASTNSQRKPIQRCKTLMAFRSGLEEKVADLLVNLGVKYEYESTKVPYILQCNYTPDFLLPNGVYLETKGQLTEEDRRKMKAVKAANPELDIRFVFQAPFNKIYKGSKTTYAKWAEKHGFLWCAFHSIPIEWLT
jgi:hypothetical protein